MAEGKASGTRGGAMRGKRAGRASVIEEGEHFPFPILDNARPVPPSSKRPLAPGTFPRNQAA